MGFIRLVAWGALRLMRWAFVLLLESEVDFFFVCIGFACCKYGCLGCEDSRISVVDKIVNKVLCYL